ncbi:3754_t:CDS:2, partial [Entrophospora sp. SA101]
SAGDDSKIDFLLNELKIDGAFNYKKSDTKKKLEELCPNGIDIYFDNVGGETLDITLPQLNKNGRVVVCGMMSQYNVEEQYGLKNGIYILTKSLLVQGFIVVDYYKEFYANFIKDMNQWLGSSLIKYQENIVVGIENSPDAFLGMLNGKNFGKLLIKTDKDSKL